MADPTYTPDFGAITEAFTETYTLGTEWLIPIAMTIMIMALITRNVEKWKILGFPILTCLLIMGIPVHMVIYAVSIIVFVLETLSLQVVGRVVKWSKQEDPIMIKSAKQMIDDKVKYREFRRAGKMLARAKEQEFMSDRVSLAKKKGLDIRNLGQKLADRADRKKMEFGKALGGLGGANIDQSGTIARIKALNKQKLNSKERAMLRQKKLGPSALASLPSGNKVLKDLEKKRFLSSLQKSSKPLSIEEKKMTGLRALGLNLPKRIKQPNIPKQSEYGIKSFYLPIGKKKGNFKGPIKSSVSKIKRSKSKADFGLFGKFEGKRKKKSKVEYY